MDPRAICFPIGIVLFIVALVLWFKENTPLAIICVLSGVATMWAGDYHSR